MHIYAVISSGDSCDTRFCVCVCVCWFSQANPGKNALLVTTENLTRAFYSGSEKTRLVVNTLTRLGAAAILMSNNKRWKASGRAKYELCGRARVQTSAREEAYR